MKDLLDTAAVYAARTLEVGRLVAEGAAAWVARMYVQFLVFRMLASNRDDTDKRGPPDER